MENYFKNNNFDIHEPITGHENRFLEKLQGKKKKSSFSKSWLGIAASVILIIGFMLGKYQKDKEFDLKNVSTEMAEAQEFFNATITSDLIKIEELKTPETKIIIEQALTKLEDLEKQYQVLKNDSKNNENIKITIMEMIRNYQHRLQILENLLKVLEQHKTTHTNNPKNEIS